MLKTVSSSSGLQLSRAWEVAKAHKGAYSGGKVELSSDGSFLACLYDADVSFVDVEEGVVTKCLTKEGEPGADEEILTFVLHPSKREIVTASRSQLLRHWDIETRDCKRAIRAHDHIVLCMEYDGTGTLVGTGGSDHTVKIWDIERGYCTHNFRGHTGIVSVLAFHPDPKRLLLVSGSEDTTVRLWNLSQQSCTAVLKAHLSYVTSLAFLSGGAEFVTGGRDRVLNVWDLNRSIPIKTFPVYEEVEGLQVLPTSAEFSEKYPTCSGGDLVAVAGKNGVVRVFSFEGQVDAEAVAKTAQEKSKSARKNKKHAEDYSATPKKAVEDSLMPPDPLPKKFSCRCVMTQDTQTASHKAGYMALVLDRRRGGLIAVTADHNLLLLEPAPCFGDKDGVAAKARGDVLGTKRQIVGYNDEVIDIKSLPRGGGNGESWVAVATNSPQVRLFELGGFSCRLLDGHKDTVLALDVAPDGRHICTSSKDRTCLLWDLDLGYPVVRWTGHSDAVGAIAASHKPGPWTPPPTTSKNNASSSLNSVSGAFVVSGAADRTLQRWEVPSRALLRFAEERKRSPLAAAVRTTSFGSGDVDGLGFEGGKEELPAPLLETAARSVRAHEKDINCVAVSPNDAVVASASQDRTVKLWRSKDLEPMGVLTGHRRGVWKVEFSPVDRCVATCSGDRTVKVWSIADCSCLRTFQGHTASVLSVTFVSAGAQLVSGGADGLLKLWTLRSDECEATLDAHTDKVWALTTTVASGKGRDGIDSQGDEEGEGMEENRRGPNAGIVVVSGGADSVINVWRDVTVREEEKLIAEKEVALLKEQELSNRLRAKDYGPAIALALELRRPHRLWGVLRDVMTDGLGERESSEAVTEMSSHNLDEYVALWSMETIAQCLGYCRDWNTNAKKAIVVHALVGSILRCVGIASLKEMPDCAELVRSILPYSERHFQRLDRLLQSSYLVEYTLASMQLLISESSDSPRTPASGRRLLEEEKIIRTNVGMDDDVGSGSESEEGRDKGRSKAVAVSEVVHGRVVFNVRPMEAVNGAGVIESSDSDEGPSIGGKGHGVKKSPRNKRKKNSDGEGKKSHGTVAPVGLLGQPDVVDDSKPVLSSDGGVDGLGGEVGTADSGHNKRKKKRKNRASLDVGDDAIGDSTERRAPEETPTKVLEVRQKKGDNIEDSGDVVPEVSSKKKRKKTRGKSASSTVAAVNLAESCQVNGASTEVSERQGSGVEVEGDSGKTEGRGKKGRKKRTKSASSIVSGGTAADSRETREREETPLEVLDERRKHENDVEADGDSVKAEKISGTTGKKRKSDKRRRREDET